MTTDGSYQWRPDAIERKAVRARQLTDPLGAWGFRRPRQRIQRETRIRQAILAVIVATYFAIVGLLYANQPTYPTATATTTSTTAERPARVDQTTDDTHVNTRSS